MESDDEAEILLGSDNEDNGGYSGAESETDPNRKELTMDQAIETTGFGRFHWFMAIVFGWANSADSIEMLSISYVLPQASCEFKATDLQLGFLTAVGFAGMMLGGYFWGTVADVKGRIKTVILCQACNALFTVASSLSQSLWFLIVMRFLSGFGVGGTSPLIFVYVVELLPAKYRGKMTAVLSIAFVLGQILVAGLAWLILPRTDWTWTTSGFTFNSWRIFFLVSAIPVTTSFLLFMFFPESPRYLMQANKPEEAKRVLRKIYRCNGYVAPYDDNYTIKRRGETGGRSGFCNIVATEGSWLHFAVMMTEMLRRSVDLVRRKDIRKVFLVSSVITAALSFSYYGLNMWFPTLLDRMDSSNATSVCDSAITSANHTKTDPCNTSGQQEAYSETFMQALSTIPGNLFYVLTIDCLGRKLVMGGSMMLTAVSVFFIWFVSNKTASIVLSCVFAGITNVSWMTMSLLTSEIFPTEIRTTAKGVQSALFNRVAAIIASVTFGALISSYCAVPILLIAALLFIGGLSVYFIPNTTNAEIG